MLSQLLVLAALSQAPCAAGGSCGAAGYGYSSFSYSGYTATAPVYTVPVVPTVTTRTTVTTYGGTPSCTAGGSCGGVTTYGYGFAAPAPVYRQGWGARGGWGSRTVVRQRVWGR